MMGNLHHLQNHTKPRRCKDLIGPEPSASRKANITRIRELLAVPQPVPHETAMVKAAPEPWRRCPYCGRQMVIIEILARTPFARAPPLAITTSREMDLMTRYRRIPNIALALPWVTLQLAQTPADTRFETKTRRSAARALAEPGQNHWHEAKNKPPMPWPRPEIAASYSAAAQPEFLKSP